MPPLRPPLLGGAKYSAVNCLQAACLGCRKPMIAIGPCFSHGFVGADARWLPVGDRSPPILPGLGGARCAAISPRHPRRRRAGKASPRGQEGQPHPWPPPSARRGQAEERDGRQSVSMHDSSMPSCTSVPVNCAGPLAPIRRRMASSHCPVFSLSENLGLLRI